MAYTTQYIGSRYVPLFAEPAEWDSTRTYEPLTIVMHDGNSYTSRQYVPVGIDITNEKFWALTGNYNAQVEQYRQDVVRYSTQLNTVSAALNAEITRATTADNKLTEDLSAEVTRATTADNKLTEDLSAEVTRATTADNKLTDDIKVVSTKLSDITPLDNIPDSNSNKAFSSKGLFTQQHGTVFIDSITTEPDITSSIKNAVSKGASVIILGVGKEYSLTEIPTKISVKGNDICSQLSYPTSTSLSDSVISNSTIDFSYNVIENVHFKNCVFKTIWSLFNNCVFEGCKFIGDVRATFWSNCLFQECPNLFENMVDCCVKNCHITSCHGDYIVKSLSTTQFIGNRIEWCDVIFNLTYTEHSLISGNLFDRNKSIVVCKNGEALTFVSNTVIRCLETPIITSIDIFIDGNSFITGHRDDDQQSPLVPEHVYDISGNFKLGSNIEQSTSFNSVNSVFSPNSIVISIKPTFTNNKCTIPATTLFNGTYNQSPNSVFNNLINVSAALYTNGIFNQMLTVKVTPGYHTLDLTAHTEPGSNIEGQQRVYITCYFRNLVK